MTQHAQPLAGGKIMAFVAATDAARAKAFYRDKLGLRLVSEDPFALVFDVAGTMLRVAMVPVVASAQYTVLGWSVVDVATSVAKLRSAGIEFERYPGMQQDGAGIWTAPNGSRVAWFKDPDGNILSVSQL